MEKFPVSVLGVEIPPNEFVILKSHPDNEALKGGIIKIFNENKITSQILSPSNASRKLYGFDSLNVIKYVKDGDNLVKHLPLGWNNPFLKIEILGLNADLCEGGKRELPIETRDKLLRAGSRWTINEILSSIPTLIGSEFLQNDMKNYLGFRRTKWFIVNTSAIFKLPQNVKYILDINNNIVRYNPIQNENFIQNNERAFHITQCLKDKNGWIDFAIVELDTQEKSKHIYKNHPEIQQFLLDIGTAGSVSLLQKIIRRRPKSLYHPDTKNKYNANEILFHIHSLLLQPSQQGIFIPDLGIYVSALQHYLKRLLICMAEDSLYNPDIAFNLAVSGLLSKNNVDWKPSQSTKDLWFDYVLNIYNESKITDYPAISSLKIKKEDLLFSECMQLKNNLPSIIHNELGGMHWDKLLLYYIRNNDNCYLNPINNNFPQPECDSLDIFCDMHIDSRYLFWIDETEKFDLKTHSYENELKKMFKAYTGLNTRKNIIDTLTHYQKQIEDALKHSSLILRKKIQPPSKEYSSTNKVEWKASIQYERIVGVIGSIKCTISKKRYIASFDPKTIKIDIKDSIVIIPSPSRENKSIIDQLSSQEVADTKNEIMKILETTGIKNKYGKITIRNGNFYINETEWNSILQINHMLYKAPQFDKIDDYFKNKPYEDIKNQIKNYTATLLAGYDDIIFFPPISRTGTGTESPLCGLERYSFNFMMYLSNLFPDAIYPTNKKRYGFHSKCMELKIEIYKILKNSSCSQLHPNFQVFSDARELTPFQNSALKDMINADNANLANFLWMLVGSGKTLTVIKFIKETKKARRVIWCMPKSAINFVNSEINKIGWKTKMLVSSASKLKFDSKWFDGEISQIPIIEEGIITIIEHDQLRLLVDKIAYQMHDTAFVFDEVHKAMTSRTLRTNSALRIAKLANQLIALTGTPIVNTKSYGLMEWLKLCAPFKVNVDNFWAAANSMTSKLNIGNVKTYYKYMDLELTQQQLLNIQQYLPPKILNGTSKHPDFNKAFEISCDIVDAKIVEITKQLVYKQSTDDEYVNITQTIDPSEEMLNRFNQRVLIVSATQAHSLRIAKLLLNEKIDKKDILIIGSKTIEGIKSDLSPNLTENNINDDNNSIKICIVDISRCEGYSLTWLTTMISGVYPSNQAKRSQMEGRINRLGCQILHKYYITVMAGITSLMFKYQRDAKNLETALKNISCRSADCK